MMQPPILHSVTVEVAGLLCRITCRHLKPILWARESHPAFLSTKNPDIDLTIVYSDAYWRRGLPWIARDTVVDAPVVSRRGERVLVHTAYYRARIDLARGLSKASMASGFRVHGLLRTLYTLFLIPRGSLLVQAVRVVAKQTSYLLFGLSEADG
jgi:hypothetical protein